MSKANWENVFRDFHYVFESPSILLLCTVNAFVCIIGLAWFPTPLFLLIIAGRKIAVRKSRHIINRREGITGSFSVHSRNRQMRRRKRCHSSRYDLAGKENNRLSSLCSMYELNVNAVVFKSCQHKCCFSSLQKVWQQHAKQYQGPSF